ERLDLYDALLRSARARGVRFAISTDAHHPNHLRNIRYGVTMARRGWLEPADVVNTLPLNEFRKLIGK
ncbi:MAG TPA: DNA polymerase III, partial [Bryobacteraceae bacterium]|nr:DNA polymerase III [Bryobacteraceae bacterium]